MHGNKSNQFFKDIFHFKWRKFTYMKGKYEYDDNDIALKMFIKSRKSLVVFINFLSMNDCLEKKPLGNG